MISINSISFPAFATFQTVERPDGKGKQPQFKKSMHDGRTLVVVPDLNALAPIEGLRIPITPGRVIAEGTQFVIATCFVPERFSVAHQVKTLLFLKKHGREERPKPAAKPMTGQFLTSEKPELMKPVRLDGPNVIGHITPEMVDALRKQRQLAGLEVPKRGVAVHVVNGHKKKAGKKG